MENTLTSPRVITPSGWEKSLLVIKDSTKNERNYFILKHVLLTSLPEKSTSSLCNFDVHTS